MDYFKNPLKIIIKVIKSKKRVSIEEESLLLDDPSLLNQYIHNVNWLGGYESIPVTMRTKSIENLPGQALSQSNRFSYKRHIDLELEICKSDYYSYLYAKFTLKSRFIK